MDDIKEVKTVAVIGAGLVGSLAALAFAKRGYQVTVFEQRGDPRLAKNKNLRSINLAVSDRGVNALRNVDFKLCDSILQHVIPMKGRMIHHVEGELESQRYDLDNQCINSIDRGYLNDLLLNELDNHELIKVEFSRKLENLNLSGQPTLTFANLDIKSFDIVIGADGVFSAVRHLLQKYIRMDFTQEYIDSTYLELRIPPGEDGDFQIDANHLHIWPRHKFMLIALPNLDGSFTSTLFAPWDVMDTLHSDEKILEFFNENFPDAVDLITEKELLYAFHMHPRGKLLSVTCNKYNHSGKCLIIGDASHGMVPFYGQGMNCGFEDVDVLMALLDKHEDDVEKAFNEYTETRHKDLVAIVDLAKENYKEMRHKVTSKLFVLRKRVDFILTYYLREKWIPLYTMVSFRSDIPYSEAVARVEFQNKILLGIEGLIVGTGVFIGVKFLKWLGRKF